MSNLQTKFSSYHIRLWLTDIVIGLCIFAGVTAVYWQSGIIVSIDSGWALPLAVNIIHDQRTDLDNYASKIGTLDYRVEKINGHYYSYFPIGTVILTLPFVWFAEKSGNLDLFAYMQTIVPNGMDPLAISLEMRIASLITALTATLIYFLGRQFSGMLPSLALACIFAFCTAAWSTASRALWAHGPSMLLITMALLLVSAARFRPWLVQFAGIPLAFSYLVRPTNSVSLILFTILMIWKYRQFFVGYILGVSLILLPFFAYNYSVYGKLLPNYYLATRLFDVPEYAPTYVKNTFYFGEALWGNLFSPSRGLFIFYPVLLFSLLGMVIQLRKRARDTVSIYLIVIIILHWISVSAYWKWWGGTAFGPRLMSDITPYLIYFLIPIFSLLATLRAAPRAMLFSAMTLSILASILINGSGATRAGGYEWNWGKYSIDDYPMRVWDWNESQVRRALDELKDPNAKRTLTLYLNYDK
jgi:hypothetical protein